MDKILERVRDSKKYSRPAPKEIGITIVEDNTNTLFRNERILKQYGDRIIQSQEYPLRERKEK